jgi:hypothetical protein
MEMQQVGVDPNDLRAQPRGPLYLDELTSSVRSVTSEKCQTGSRSRLTACTADQARERQTAGQSRINAIVMVGVAPGSVTSALEPLRMAKKLDPYRETARMALEPWLVEAVLARQDPGAWPLEFVDERHQPPVKSRRFAENSEWPINNGVKIA